MQTYSVVVRCPTCSRVISQASGIPGTQEDTTQAAEAATRVLACPERGHMRNSNLAFEWTADPPGTPVAINRPRVVPSVQNPGGPVSPPVAPSRDETTIDPARASTFDAHGNPLLSDDELTAAIAEHEAKEAMKAPEVLEVRELVQAPPTVAARSAILSSVSQASPASFGQVVHGQQPVQESAPFAPSAPSAPFDLGHERLDEHHPGPAPEPHDPHETSALAARLANGTLDSP